MTAHPATPVLATEDADERRPNPFWLHDVPVVLVALLLLGAGAAIHRHLTRPAVASYAAQGLTLRYPRGWLPTQLEGSSPTDLPLRIVFQPLTEPLVALEVQVLPRPEFAGPIEAALELERGQRHGDLYTRLSSDVAKAGGADWIRTRYAYAYRPTEEDVPAVAFAVEYAHAAGDRLYVVTIHGPEERTLALEPTIAPSLAVAGAGSPAPTAPAPPTDGGGTP